MPVLCPAPGHQEGIHQWDVSLGHSVSDSFLSIGIRVHKNVLGPKYIRLTNARICALTVYRIKVTSDVNFYDWQATWASIAFLICMEALQGVIDACLTVMKPVLNRGRRLSPAQSSSSKDTYGRRGGGSTRTANSIHQLQGSLSNHASATQSSLLKARQICCTLVTHADYPTAYLSQITVVSRVFSF